MAPAERDSSARLYRRDLIGLALLAAVVVIAGLGLSKSYHLTLLVYSGIYAIAALGIADRAYVMETGEIILEGDARDLLHNPEVRRAYLGKGYKEIWE